MKYLVFVFIAVILSACASIFYNADQKVKLDSKPHGATVYINGYKAGVTPAVFTLKRKQNTYEILLKKNGYKDVKLHTKRTVNLLATLNIFTYGLGLIVDHENGTMYKHLPGNIKIKMPRTNDNTLPSLYPEPTPFIRSIYINIAGRNFLNILPFSLDFDFHISSKILINAGIGGFAPLVNGHLYFTYLFSGYGKSFEISAGIAYHEYHSLDFGGGSSKFIENGFGIGTEIGYRYQPRYGGILFRTGLSLTYISGLEKYKEILYEGFYRIYKNNFFLFPYISLGFAF